MEYSPGNKIEITPSDVMKYRLDRGDIKLKEYIEWFLSDQNWNSVKESIKKINQ